MSQKRLNDQEKIDVVKLYTTGQFTCQDLGKRFGITNSAINGLLRRRNIKINNNFSKLHRIYNLNENYFDIIDTEDKAYFLGFLYSDGNISSRDNEITLGLQKPDIKILEQLKEKIGSNRPLIISKRKNINCHEIVRLSISSKHIKKSLIKLGCLPKKSLILQFPTFDQIPQSLLRHFIRGFYDGDGGISNRMENNRLVYKIYFTSTKQFCENLKSFLSKELDGGGYIRTANNHPTTRTLEIKGRRQIIKILNWLYKDATIYLDRKYQKYQDILNLPIKNKMNFLSCKSKLEIIEKYKTGSFLQKDLALEYGVNRLTILKLLKKNNVKTFNRYNRLNNGL